MESIVAAYCMQWHLTRSSAFEEVLVAPLSPYTDICLEDGEDSPKYKLNGGPLIFCQLRPPPAVLSDPKARIVWIPMWDEAKNYPKSLWDSLPKSLRVVAFSDGVAQRARFAGLPTLRLRFFKDPSAFPPPSWEGGRTLMYWNRTGMIDAAFLERLCTSLKIDRLLFRSKIDPYLPAEAYYALPSRLGTTVVEEIPGVMSQAEYLKLLARVNVYVAPRLYEGVGLTFLEALAQGCAVFAHNAPTMNEYIRSRKNGFLFKSALSSRTNEHRRIRDKIRAWLRQGLRRDQKEAVESRVAESQNWNVLQSIDLEKLGNAARHSHMVGFRAWQNSLPQYADFILNW